MEAKRKQESVFGYNLSPLAEVVNWRLMESHKTANEFQMTSALIQLK